MKIFSKTYRFSPLNLISKYRLNRQTHILFEILYEYWFCVSWRGGGGGQNFVFGPNFVWNTLWILVLYKRKYVLFFGQCLHFATNSLPISPCTQSHIPQQLLHILIRPKISRKYKKQRKDYNKWKRDNHVFYFTMRIAYFPPTNPYIFVVTQCHHEAQIALQRFKGLFTWSRGPRSSGVGFFCFHGLGDTNQKKPTPLNRGPPLHVNRV